MLSTHPEVQLLLLCARPRTDSEAATRIEALAQEDINWNYLLETARAHGVMPLLYRSLSLIRSEAVPKETLDRLRGYFYKNAQRNLFMTGELLRLLNLFETHGISALPYKGPSLAAFVYGNLALRQFVDLDILVREQDFPKVKDQLLSQGYRPEHKLTYREETVLLRSTHEYPFMHYGKRVMVDLQWKISPRFLYFPLDLECLWKRLEPRTLVGKEVLTFSSEDLLLILCVHGSRHLWQSLELVCDVAELIHVDQGMNWEQVMQQAATLGSERMLLLGLYLANNLLMVDLPEKVWQRVQADPQVKTLAEQVHERLLWRDSGPPRVFSEEEFPFYTFHLRMRERLRDKIIYCVRLSTTTTVRDWMFLPLPRYLHFLYYILRPIRLIEKYGRRLLGRRS